MDIPESYLDGSLEQSSRYWHDRSHDPWPCLNYLMPIFRAAYEELRADPRRYGEGEVGDSE